MLHEIRQIASSDVTQWLLALRVTPKKCWCIRSVTGKGEIFILESDVPLNPLFTLPSRCCGGLGLGAACRWAAGPWLSGWNSVEAPACYRVSGLRGHSRWPAPGPGTAAPARPAVPARDPPTPAVLFPPTPSSLCSPPSTPSGLRNPGDQ